MKTVVRSIASLALVMTVACGGDDTVDEIPDEDPGDDQQEYFEEPSVQIDGKVLGEWGASWWQWALSLPATNHPVLGGDCDQAQSGDVFFLAGNFGNELGMPEQRSCTVPAGKQLFFPLLTSLCYPRPENGCDTPRTEAELTSCAASLFGNPGIEITVSVDGQTLDDPLEYRDGSAQFSWTTPAEPLDPGAGPIGENACEIPEGDRFGVTDGFWMMLRPLSPGEHSVRFTATTGGAQPFTLDVSYTITQL